ncbi:hypothetical protein COD51_24795 [Escherichia coli]|nr:hypothetical protein COD51_24795 [Escherichia coli]PBQ91232.1 hypothetical protein COD37_25415 [Escherichia coli]
MLYSLLYVEQETAIINIAKIYFVQIQHINKMMMMDKNSKISLFPRVRIPPGVSNFRKDPRRSGCFINVMRYAGLGAHVIRMHIPNRSSQNRAADVVLLLSPS